MGLIASGTHEWLFGIFLFCLVIVFGSGIHYFLFRLVRKKQATALHTGLNIQKYLAKPARAVLLAMGLLIVLPMVTAIPEKLRGDLEHYTWMALVILLGWLAISGVYLFEAAVHSRFDIRQADNLRARQVHTQIQFFRRMLVGLVIVLDVVALLWSLHNPQLWKLGTGLLASAGLASLVLATAAKSTASNLLAGMQIALTEPIRIDDVVVIAGEWGRISEITSTYVVVSIWDQRTLIVPLSYFIEQPFTNWTRSGADIMGTAFLYVDYSVPVEPLRTELRRIAEHSPLWDGRVCGLQVTNLTEHTMELRCLVSSADSGKNFDLRCEVREKMIDFVRANFPHALPTLRMELRDRASGMAALPA